MLRAIYFWRSPMRMCSMRSRSNDCGRIVPPQLYSIIGAGPFVRYVLGRRQNGCISVHPSRGDLPHERSPRRGIESNRFTPNDQETYNVEYSEMYPRRINLDFRCTGFDRRMARERFSGHCADIRVSGSNEGNSNLYCPSSIAS